MQKNIDQAASSLFYRLRHDKKKLVIVESVTGGRVSAELTKISGASEVLWGAYVVYSIDAKQNMLSVSSQTLTTYGAVSAETTAELAAQALAISHADIAVAVTGFAGSTGVTATDRLFEPNTARYPVGTIFCACCTHAKAAKPSEQVKKEHFFGSREEIQMSAVLLAYSMVRSTLS